MKIIKLFFANVIFLFILSLGFYVVSIIIPPSAYAITFNCNAPDVCLPNGNCSNGGTPLSLCDSSTGSMCCTPPTPECNTDTQWTVSALPYNTCYKNNEIDSGYDYAYTGGGPCNVYYYGTRTVTTNNCAGPHTCNNGVCIPWCSTGNQYTACNADGRVGANTTCNTNNALEECTYTTAPGFGGNCVRNACANRACTFNSCNLPQFECLGGGPQCTEYFTISGTITDVDGNGTPSIPVNGAGCSSAGGAWTFGYGCKIKKGGYTVSEAIPANYIPIGTTSQGVTVGPNKAGVNFTVARVFSVTGSVVDVDGNGTPAIPVTCTGNGGGGTASGGNFTIPYSAHIRRGNVTCTEALPANYIPIGVTSISFAVGPDKTGVNFQVARVFSITGSIVDVDGNGPTNIAVTCADNGPGGETATLTGGNFTFPYADHYRRGQVTCTLALPANYIAINPNPPTIAFGVGPDRAGVNFGVARVFSIAGQVYDSLNGNAGVPNVQVQTTGCVVQTNGGGNYLLPYTCHLRSINSPYTVTVTVPAGYTNTGVTSQNVTVGPDQVGINFAITKLFTVSGDVFLDYSIDQLQDNNPYTGGLEPNYAVRPVIQAQEALPPLSTDALNITTNADGTYIIANLVTGNVTASYLSLPTDYYMTTPRNGPPATYQVAPGFACNTNGAPGANCVNAPGPGGGQDITNLNFGIIDVYPWVQTVCSDIRDNNGFTNREYYNDSAIITNGSCSTPGTVYTGNGNANFGRGNASSTGQVIGGFQYPEVYDDTGSQELLSYTNLSGKAQTAGVAETNLTNVNGCGNLANCTLPGTLTHGIYVANGDVTLNAFTFPAGNYVFLINGNLTITGNIIVPAGTTVVFAVSGNITIPATVGSAANSTNPNLEGVFSTEKSFIVQNTGAYCTDLRLNIQGSVIINAGNNGGTLQNNRNLCLNDAWFPTIQITQRPDFLLNMPEFIRDEKIVSHELTP